MLKDVIDTDASIRLRYRRKVSSLKGRNVGCRSENGNHGTLPYVTVELKGLPPTILTNVQTFHYLAGAGSECVCYATGSPLP
ncbi:hypothetical protein CEXT_622811 [Caerostris extrusa]|uniref:Uncharacterized protein n=1 Tax=Caerostris extrusa TaxID=172846 RepID=A0AAV4USA8_CAEEX|nr:hypothetical protein CEXT_622811 [Caerostris extrusa]